MRKLLFVTGSRGEWGYIRPLLRLCAKSNDFKCEIVATNMHLLPAFGQSINEILSDGFEVRYKIYMALDGYNHFSMAKSLGIFMSSMADILSCEKPDFMILAGDRGEQLSAAVAAAFCYTPIAHIQAGELSGNVDGMTRHAIGKYAHLHFASNEDAANRLIRLGEQSHRIHMVGAPQLDELAEAKISTPEEVSERMGFDINHDYILVVQHPVTEEYAQAGAQIAVTMSVLSQIKLPKVVILPNNDAGSEMIRDGINRYKKGDFRIFSNLKREDYLALLQNAKCMVGNSSSGLLEAPTFKVPVLNLGRRQEGRVRGQNVIDVQFDAKAIKDALDKALSRAFVDELRKNCVNPYGDGKSASRILDVLRNTPIDDKLIVKSLTY